MMKCWYCGGEVTEAEYKERYDEFLAQGIVPMMMPSHKACRTPENEAASDARGSEILRKMVQQEREWRMKNE